MDLVGEGVPVAVSGADDVGGSVLTSLIVGVPKGLATRVADVLGSATETNDVNLAAFVLEVVGSLKLFLPTILVVESIELDVVRRRGSCNDRILAVEQGHHVVTILDFGLVGGDGDDLVARKHGPDPLLEVSGVLCRVSVTVRFGLRVSRGPRLSPSCHRNFNY